MHASSAQRSAERASVEKGRGGDQVAARALTMMRMPVCTRVSGPRTREEGRVGAAGGRVRGGCGIKVPSREAQMEAAASVRGARPSVARRMQAHW
eukprot:1942591-Rhodomonas_salina.2